MMQHMAGDGQLAGDGPLEREGTEGLDVSQQEQTSWGWWLMMEVGTLGEVRLVCEAAGHDHE